MKPIFKSRTFAAILALCLFFPAKILFARPGNPIHRKKVFAALSKGTLQPDASGVVVLPKQLSSASCNARAYVTRKGQLMMVFFPTWFGKGANVQGFLMCNRALESETVEIRYPMLLARSRGIGSNTVNIGRKVSNNTYFVLYNLD